MGREMRAFNWAATPLGPFDTWPQSLRASVGVMLRSRFAMWMAWGPELTFFCNDAYRPTLGVKQAWALGAPASQVWAEIWTDIGPRIEAVLSTGEATWDEGLRLFLERSGYLEETYHTFSYSPLANDQGTVEGMLCVVAEETQRVVGERRLRTLRDLAARVIDSTTREEACRTAAQTMAHNPIDLPYAAFYLLDEQPAARLCEATGLPPESALTPTNVLFDPPEGAIAAAFAQACRSGEATLVDLAGLDSPPTEPWHEPPQRAYVLPIARRGEGFPAGLLVAGVNTRRDLDDGQRPRLGGRS